MIIYKEILNYKPLLCFRYLWLDQQDVEKASASKRLDFLRESGVKLLLSRHYSPRLLSLRSSWDTSTPRMGNETHIHVLLYRAYCLLKRNFSSFISPVTHKKCILLFVWQRMEGWVTDISPKKTVYPASFYQLWPPDDPENEGHPAGWGGGSGSDGAAQCGAEQWWCSGAGQQWEDHYSRDCPIHLGGERERKKKEMSVPLFCLVYNSLLVKTKNEKLILNV